MVPVCALSVPLFTNVIGLEIPIVLVPDPAVFANVPAFSKVGGLPEVYWIPASLCRLNAALLVNVAALFRTRLPAPDRLNIPALVTMPPDTVLPLSPDALRVAPAGTV